MLTFSLVRGKSVNLGLDERHKLQRGCSGLDRMSANASPTSESQTKKREKGFITSLKRLLRRPQRAVDSTAQLRPTPLSLGKKSSVSSGLLTTSLADNSFSPQSYEPSFHGSKAPPRPSTSMPHLLPLATNSSALPTYYASPLQSGAGRRVFQANSSSSVLIQLPPVDSCAPALSSSAIPDNTGTLYLFQNNYQNLPSCSSSASRLRNSSSVIYPQAQPALYLPTGALTAAQSSSGCCPERSAASVPLPLIRLGFQGPALATASMTASPTTAVTSLTATTTTTAASATPATAVPSNPVAPSAVNFGNRSSAAGQDTAMAAATDACGTSPAAAAAAGPATVNTTPSAPTTTTGHAALSQNVVPLSAKNTTSEEVTAETATMAPVTTVVTSIAEAEMEPTSALLAVCPAAPDSMRRPLWRLSDYIIGGRLYKGEVSSVYKAICGFSGLKVVLKVYSLHRVADNALHTLAREVRIHTDLAHDNILTLYGVFEEEGRLVLVLERAVRGDLFRLHRSTPNCRMSEDQLRVLVLVPLLEALVYMHSRGVCHRDIKPENLLMSVSWQLRVADFGAAINLTQERAVTRTGTMDYMAPEVERCPLKLRPEDNKGNPSLAYSTAADVWSVGVLAYEMLVGFPPFINCSKGDVDGGGGDGGGGDVGDDRPRELCFPHFVSAGGQDFISSALAERPTDRPTAPQLLRHPWLKFATREYQARKQQQQPKTPTAVQQDQVPAVGAWAFRRPGPLPKDSFLANPNSPTTITTKAAASIARS
ncbi:hypothetical protein Vretifemale_9818 [Volvox reticuliferus]|uniref:Protein kinase domain-containing protein n=2 Tax=Volvox reticuliferus TaxID=1737510 RepID=A0A8J4CFI6_9CHLO|nr:hypothetical protein Vretifemale_9818 [Volvox reticuliferus]